jgi:two-component system, OmpR family, response regulator
LFVYSAGPPRETFGNDRVLINSDRETKKISMTATPHILVVEDDLEISRLVTRYLRANDCRVSSIGDGRNLGRVLEDDRVDLIVLDLMLPGENGLNLCQRLRTHSDVPVIMLTAKGEDVDRIVGLEMGADDYVAKPFNPRELLARIRAVLRRAGAVAANPTDGRAREMTFLGWRLDCTLRELKDPRSTRIALTAAEFDLLQVLCERAGRVLSREQLFNLTHGQSVGSLARSVDVLVSRLRRKIEEDPRDPIIIKTVRSGGYIFTAAVERA